MSSVTDDFALVDQLQVENFNYCGLEKYTANPQCPKCNFLTLITPSDPAYCKGKTLFKNKCHLKIKIEHLHMECKRCGYKWGMACADSDHKEELKEPGFKPAPYAPYTPFPITYGTTFGTVTTTSNPTLIYSSTGANNCTIDTSSTTGTSNCIIGSSGIPIAAPSVNDAKAEHAHPSNVKQTIREETTDLIKLLCSLQSSSSIDSAIEKSRNIGGLVNLL